MSWGSSLPGLGTLAAFALAATGVWTLPAGAAGSTVLQCNASARLCDTQLGSVAFATTHNSMSSPADGFRGPNQGRPIVEQLQHGIRGLQIDAFLGVARKGRVYTELAGPFGSQATDLPPALVATAEGSIAVSALLHREVQGTCSSVTRSASWERSP